MSMLVWRVVATSAGDKRKNGVGALIRVALLIGLVVVGLVVGLAMLR